MSAPSYFVSEAVIRNFKNHAARRVSGVSSAHMTEAIAAALGFRTHAALRAALHGRATAQACKPSNALAVRRLRDLGYDVPNDLHFLPELDRSYFAFKTAPLRKKRGVRWMAWRNMMVAAINAGLERRLFGLSPGEDWWLGANSNENDGIPGHYRFKFGGSFPATATVAAIRGDELAIHVLLSPRNEEINADFNDGLVDGSATAHGWLERRLGAWIHDGGEAFSCKRAIQTQVAEIEIEPIGYADFGSFIL